jgi:hypothetical protein
MAKTVIVLEQSNDDPSKFHVLYCLNVTAGREGFYAKVGAVSKWPGASAGENSAIAAGTIKEEEDVYSRSDGAGLAQVQADLLAARAARQAALDLYNPWNRFGSFFDDVAGWTLTGVS